MEVLLFYRILQPSPAAFTAMQTCRSVGDTAVVCKMIDSPVMVNETLLYMTWLNVSLVVY